MSHMKNIKSNLHKAFLTWKNKTFLSDRYQLFIYITNCRRLVESLLSFIHVHWGRQTGRSSRSLEGFFLLNSSRLFSSSGRPAAVDTDASPKCCHSGAGPPNRYEITTRPYQCHVSQQQESNYTLYTSLYLRYL